MSALRSYPAIVREVHDGDTVVLDVDLGFDQWSHSQRFRLDGLDAPELATPAGQLAAAWLATRLPVGTRVDVWSVQVKDRAKREKYGRWLAQVWLSGENLNALLVEAGHAKPWNGKGARP